MASDRYRLVRLVPPALSLSVVFAVMALLTPPWASAQPGTVPSFAPAVTYPVGFSPRSVAVGYFNGDATPDLAVANSGSHDVSILLGNGNGTFQAAASYGAQSNPFSVAVGDFNGDGRPDLAVANIGSETVSILLGNGNGTFQAAMSYGAGEVPISVAVGEFNGDGRLDLAVANTGGLSAGTETVSVLLGNGDGTFGPPVGYISQGLSASQVVVGDLDGDAKGDLLVANQSGPGSVSVLRGNGDGSFQTGVTYPVGGSPSSVAIADVNEDGKHDLAVAAGFGVVLLLGNGDGTFLPGGSWPAGTDITFVAAGDLFGSGWADLVVANRNASAVSVVRGRGNGTFQPPVTYATGGFYSESVAVADLNGDGRPDLVVANGTSTVGVLINIFGVNLGCAVVLPGIQDGAFGAGPPWPAWTEQTSTSFGTPLCIPETCGTGGGTAGPRSGSGWAWFGGSPQPEVATLAQAVTLPTSADLRLRFHMFVGFVTAPFSDQLWATVDGSGVQVFPEPSVPEGGYTLREVDLTPYVGSHNVGFFYSGGASNFSVDDVDLVTCSVPAISVNDVSVTEVDSGSVLATFTVSLGFASTRTVTVNYVLTPITANADVDYDHSHSSPGQLSFPPGTTALPISVPIIGDTIAENDETFVVELNSAAFGLIARSRGEATIVDDDGADVSITKTDGLTFVMPGQPVTYTIVASNAGPSVANGARVVDTVPASLTGASWTCAGVGGASCAPGGSGHIDDFAHLPVGATATYTLSGTVAAVPTSLRNTATVTLSQGRDPDPSNNTATDDDAILCFGEVGVVPDGRIATSTIAPGETAWFGGKLKLGDSYSLELVNTEGTGPPGTLTIFAGDDGCTGTSTLTTTDTTTVDPGVPAVSRRFSFTATGAEFFRAKLVNSAGVSMPFSISLADTALYSAAWSTNASFDTFYSFQNTTGAALNGTLTLLDTSGAALSTFNLMVPAGQTASTNSSALGITRNRIGTARLSHDGPPGAVLAEAAIANFTLSPAYVQPVRFQTVREAR